MKPKDYFAHAHRPVVQRDPVWTVVAAYIQKMWLRPQDHVLDLGAGYCSFINHIEAERRVALDANPDVVRYVRPGVEAIAGNATDLSLLASDTFDVVFSSNLLEHLDYDQIFQCVREMSRTLKPKGLVILLIPNFYYAYREYFHDFTHKTILTHVGLSDLFESEGFRCQAAYPRFLPYSMQKKYGGIDAGLLPAPLLRLLVRLYIASPFKPFGKQMLLVFSNGSE